MNDGERTEWLCPNCNCVHLRPAKRIYHPCPVCTMAMTPTSFNQRRIKAQEAEITRLNKLVTSITGDYRDTQIRVRSMETEIRELEHEISSLTRQLSRAVQDDNTWRHVREDCTHTLPTAELRRDAERYRHLRCYTPREFNRLYQENIETGKPFDCLIDTAIAAEGEKK